MSKLIITTVGTSVITNKLYSTKFETEIKELVDDVKDPRYFTEIVNDTVHNIVNKLNNNVPNKQLSAELASLRAFKNNSKLGISNDDVIVLFSTDTEEGKFCAKVNEEVLRTINWCQIQPYIAIKGLKTKRTKEDEDITKNFIDAALVTLKNKTEELLNGQTYTGKYFNITGGFKGTIPFVTVLAFEKQMNIFYLYEESNDLIVISPPHTGHVSTYDELVRLVSQLGA